MSHSVLFHDNAYLQTLSACRLTVLLAAIFMSRFRADYLQLQGGLSMVTGQIICVLLRDYPRLPAWINHGIPRNMFSFSCHVPYLIAVSWTICLVHWVVPTIVRSEDIQGNVAKSYV